VARLILLVLKSLMPVDLLDRFALMHQLNLSDRLPPWLLFVLLGL
jgi:hypothetical protein